jgi:hypothetical protein
VRAKRSRDLNRLLDKPGPGARVSSHRKYLFWKLPRFEVVPGNLESENPFRASRHGARKRVGAFIGLSSRRACEPMGKTLPDSADGAGISLDGLGLQSLELQVFQMQLVVLIEHCLGRRIHLGVTSWLVVKQPLMRGDEVTF